MNKERLLGKNMEEFTLLVKELGMPKFTAKQIAEWIYKKQVRTIDEMSNISLKNRELLSEKYCVGVEEPIHCSESKDGTKKYLFHIDADKYVESVYIPEEDRATLCVSIQVGCKMNCLFCMTGKQGFRGHLSSADVLNQIVAIPECHKLTNIVFMGMGEPFDNIDVILKSTNIITAEYGLGWSPKRLTVSSIGIIPSLRRFLAESKAHLAISMHSPFDDEREELMPIQKVYKIADVIEEIKRVDFGGQRRVSFEYIMFANLNDSIRHAIGVMKLVKDIDCRVNLIRFHSIPGVDLKTSDEKRMKQFADYLNNNGVRTTIRQSRGEDIEAACGMLSTKEQNKTNK